MHCRKGQKLNWGKWLTKYAYSRRMCKKHHIMEDSLQECAYFAEVQKNEYIRESALKESYTYLLKHFDIAASHSIPKVAPRIKHQNSERNYVHLRQQRKEYQNSYSRDILTRATKKAPEKCAGFLHQSRCCKSNQWEERGKEREGLLLKSS